MYIRYAPVSLVLCSKTYSMPSHGVAIHRMIVRVVNTKEHYMKATVHSLYADLQRQAITGYYVLQAHVYSSQFFVQSHFYSSYIQTASLQCD